MATEIIMPKAGMDMQERQIIKWHKKEGDYVEKGDVLLEIMTDKVNMEVEAETSGYLLKILKNEGEVVPVIATIGYIGEKDEDISQIVGFQSLSNGNKLIEGKKIILAGGSKAARIDIPGIESKLVLTSDEILNLKEIPKELVIIGGGAVGVELGAVFSSFGSKVTIIEMMDRIVSNMDEDISTLLEDSLIKKGVKILTSVRLQRITEKNEKLVIEVDKGESMTADKALLSIGRIPDLEGAGDIKFEMEKGRIKVNDYMETNVEGIYAPGDINGKRMLAHAAFKMGEVAAVNAMGGREKINLNCVPSCIYTVPEAASVGLTEEEAKKSYSISVGKFPFAANGRALSSGETSGFVKVIIDKKYGEILGVHIIGPSASEIINEASSLMAMEITAYEASEIVHGHPTFSEALQEACADSLGKAVHLPKRK